MNVFEELKLSIIYIYICKNTIMIPPPPPHHHHHHHDLHRRRRRPHRCHHCHRCHYTIVIIGPQQRVNNRKDHPSPAEKATATVSCSLPSWESKSLIPAVASEASSLWPTECGYCCCWCWWWLSWWWWRRRKQFRRRRWQWHCDVYSSQKNNCESYSFFILHAILIIFWHKEKRPRLTRYFEYRWLNSNV